MTITVRHKGRSYEWRKSNNNWFTDKNNVVKSKSLKDQLSKKTHGLNNTKVCR